MKQAIAGLLPGEIPAFCGISPPYRGLQIFKHIHNDVYTFPGMSTLPAAVRARLDSNFTIQPTAISNTLEDSSGTVKLQIELTDGLKIESVLLGDREGRKTACISSQAGCSLGCSFCKTGSLGFARDLDTSEIIEQYLHLKHASAEGISNVVFMGMGEPLLNLAAVERSLAILNHPEGPNISRRKITVSTCGIPDGIRHIADHKAPCELAFSLVTSNEDLRKTLMPVTKKHTLADVKKSLLYYQDKTGRRITLEVVLIKGQNDAPQNWRTLEQFISGLSVILNVIPWNPVPGFDFETPDETAIGEFFNWLEKKKIPQTRRYRRGSAIGAACGQLGAVE